MKKQIKVEIIENIAKTIVRDAFKQEIEKGAKWLDPEQEKNLYKEVFILDDKYVFELNFYPDGTDWNCQDPYVVARLAFNKYTKEQIGNVEVYLPPVLASELPEIN